jgi:oligoendopeptidase F
MSPNAHDWSNLQPLYEALEREPVSAENAAAWLLRWSDLERGIYEVISRAYRAKSEDTTDQAAERNFLNLVENVVPHAKVAHNKLEQKLAALPVSDLPNDALELVKRTAANLEIFREANVTLETELDKLGVEYDKIVGAFTIMLNGEELTLYGAFAKLQEPDRTVRETAYRALVARWEQDRAALEELFMQMLHLRRQIAKNAGFSNYRELVWKAKSRFDYSPEDCRTLHRSILEHIVPVLQSEMTKHRESLGLQSLKPWDVEVDSGNRPPLKPFNTIQDLETVCQRVFASLDSELGQMFGTLMIEDLDLESRKGKGPGGYCDFHPQSGRAYIFMNAVGTQDDVQTLLHEGGHAFHALESNAHQKLYWNLHGPMEFCEVASMGMEMLAQPYLERANGGFYSPEDAARARRDQLLEAVIKFLPYMAVVDAFQHWLYVDAPEHVTIHEINTKWAELHTTFLPHVDFAGTEQGLAFRWQRQGHIFTAPFYYIEYGIAQLGAVQVWQNALQNEAQAVKLYREALSLGYTRGLRDLFETAGIKLAFDSGHVAGLTRLVQQHL